MCLSTPSSEILRATEVPPEFTVNSFVTPLIQFNYRYGLKFLILKNRSRLKISKRLINIVLIGNSFRERSITTTAGFDSRHPGAHPCGAASRSKFAPGKFVNRGVRLNKPSRSAAIKRKRPLKERPFSFKWSEWPDLNRRPPHPQYGALPGCATLRDPGANPLIYKQLAG